VVQDYGLSLKAVMALHICLEREYELAASDAENIMEVAELACFVCLGYARGIRGEEI
jgi:hypothetical protein